MRRRTRCAPARVGAARLPYQRARRCEGRLTMVRTGRWKYVYDSGNPVEELYDLQTFTPTETPSYHV